MSGTSLDAVDGCVVHFADDHSLRVETADSMPFPSELREALLDLCEARGDDLQRIMRAEIQLTELYADLTRTLLGNLKDDLRHRVGGLGTFGQTIRHHPEDSAFFSAQLVDGARLAEMTQLPTVCDIRRSDIARGGQGAPMAPAFHRWAFAQKGQDIGVANLGGIANLTCLGAEGDICGTDTGPANLLMDAWCLRHLGKAWDADGQWACSGKPDAGLLALLETEPWLALPPPKSTGRELFNLPWLEAKLDQLGRNLAPVDVQATLLRYSARTLCRVAAEQSPGMTCLYLCGGGARNDALVAAIADEVRHAFPETGAGTTEVASTLALGLDPQLVEACCVAWFARERLEDRYPDMRSITGSKTVGPLGAVYLP